ncbi:ubiquitin-like domain-containing protein CIP73 isoform X1 [Senna tora]|uniref:Ubiquitin-like domain-containing protein CIP73 isoform X1 n=1 Tax=Senna tora TaxID=362788 RepID=A0A834SZS8_9FABA|nr:ubiquitin-like domain-containing protein CIP73 isoform X1 [Senna tora]
MSIDVEDGHTLHLVVRQPDLPSLGSLPNHSATDPRSSTSNSHSNQVAPGVFIETFNVPVQGDGVPPEVNRSGDLRGFNKFKVVEKYPGHDSQGLGRTSASTGILDSFHPQPEQAGSRSSSDRLRFGLPTAISSLGSLQPPVIPDSLTTLSQYLTHLRNEFEAIDHILLAVREGGNNVQAAEAHRSEEGSISSSSSVSAPEGILSPASLAEVLHSTRRMFIEQAGEGLYQLARQLENQANVTDPLLRSNAQSRAWRSGVLFYNLGAFLLELGRTTMALRLGQTPSEAVANGGPAVFISSSGPNHIMVQPFPFQPGSSFGAAPVAAVQPPSGLGSGLGSSFYPRRIDIQIRRGTSTSAANVNREEQGDAQTASVQRNPVEVSVNQASSRLPEDLSFAGESGVRIVPIRTMVAAVPTPLARTASESSGNSIGLYYPVIGRFQQAPSGPGNIESGSQQPSPLHASGLHAAQQSTPESTGQRQSTDDPVRNGSSSAPSLRQEASNSRRVNINILTAGGLQNSNQESERQIPNNVLQFIRALFPGGEIHVEDSSSQGTTAGGSAPDHAGTSTGVAPAPEAEPRVSEEGLFLSNLLREVMPLISQQAGSGTHLTSQGENASDDQTASDSSTQVGSSRRQSDSEPVPPNPKRQKIEASFECRPKLTKAQSERSLIYIEKRLGFLASDTRLHSSTAAWRLLPCTERERVPAAATMAEQTEKAFLKQPKVFLCSKKSGKGKRPGKGGNRFWKSIGLGFKTPRDAIEGTYIDKKCPFTGTVSIRGRILAGTCHSAKMTRTIIVRRNYLHFVKKYQRPISKTVRFNVLKVIPAGSSSGVKKAFTGI